MRVAILHNLRPQETSPSLPDDAFEEYDSPETIEAIGTALAGLGVRPEPVVADKRLPWRLEEGRFDFVFNIAEGNGWSSREAIPAAVCELMGIPFTGSDTLTLAVTLDKAMARRVVSPDVPVARGVLVSGQDSELRLNELRCPVLVKPNGEGSSKGIRAGSLCYSRREATERCRWLRDRYACSALVEEFLSGTEVTVGVRGNGADTRVLGSMEIAPAADSTQPFYYSLEVKRDWRNQVKYYAPPRLTDAKLDQIHAYALAAYRLLGCRDVARLDFRLNSEAEPVFLECNPLPGLSPESSDVVILSRRSCTYDELVQGILHDAALRVGVCI